MAKTNPAEFVRQIRQEGSKVTWPNRKETTISTFMVFVMVFFASIFLFLADQVISMIIQFVLGLG